MYFIEDWREKQNSISIKFYREVKLFIFVVQYSQGKELMKSKKILIKN